MTDRYELINREEGSYPISSMCRRSRVSKSGYYSWRDRPQSQTAIRREELTVMIREEFEDSDGTYGYRRIQVVLERRGVRADGATIRASCVTWGYRPPGLGRKSEPPYRLRTWESARTCSGGTSPLTSPARSCAGTFPRKRRCPLLRQDVGRIHLSRDRFGLLY